MPPGWEPTSAPPVLEGEALYLDAVLRPHRSLSAAAFKLMLMAVIGVNVGVGAAFLAQGAYPVTGFLGLDVVALWIAFRVNYRAGRREERVRLTRAMLHLERRDANGAMAHWVLNPIWAQVSEDGRGVAVASGGGAMRLATFLPADERRTFASALRTALYRARSGY